MMSSWFLGALSIVWRIKTPTLMVLFSDVLSDYQFSISNTVSLFHPRYALKHPEVGRRGEITREFLRGFTGVFVDVGDGPARRRLGLVCRLSNPCKSWFAARASRRLPRLR